ncbi:MAG: class I SAM-dependent methyltransferase [Candidatus Solibacter usitatus]|nr:class I SAM-dependent methyltransferase [Candidatus Solibacter usitatus]
MLNLLEDRPRLPRPAPRPRTTSRRSAWLALALVAALYIAALASAYPFDSDPPLTRAELDQTASYYQRAYSIPDGGSDSAADDVYVRVAAQAARLHRIPERVQAFVNDNRLGGAKVLEIGAGRGYLQDHVRDYTGLDISSTAHRFFHKPYVRGSATAMPFADSSFDAAWSIWVFEHIPNPEQALRETRRVLKDGALLYFLPAWDCPPWAAEGLPVRPASQLTLGQRLVRSTIDFRTTNLFWLLTKPPVRAARALSDRLAGGPATLHYRRLQPNYDKYWMADSDAVNSLDRDEARRWFTSRGDECLNCASQSFFWPEEDPALIIRIHKRP